MKWIKKIIISIVIVMVILFTNTIPMTYTKEDRDVQYIRTNWIDGMNGETYILESKEELAEYLNKNREKHNLGHNEKVYSDTTIGFEDAIVDYDEEWFKDNNLVLILLTADSGSIRYKVNSIDINNGKMDISFKKEVPEIGTCDMAGWHIIVETEKVSIEEINVFIEEIEIVK